MASNTFNAGGSFNDLQKFGSPPVVPSPNMSLRLQAPQAATSAGIALSNAYEQTTLSTRDYTPQRDGTPLPAKRGRGRPRGSKNKPKDSAALGRAVQPKRKDRLIDSKYRAKSSPPNTPDPQGVGLSKQQGFTRVTQETTPYPDSFSNFPLEANGLATQDTIPFGPGISQQSITSNQGNKDQDHYHTDVQQYSVFSPDEAHQQYYYPDPEYYSLRDPGQHIPHLDGFAGMALARSTVPEQVLTEVRGADHVAQEQSSLDLDPQLPNNTQQDPATPLQHQSVDHHLPKVPQEDLDNPTYQQQLNLIRKSRQAFRLRERNRARADRIAPHQVPSVSDLQVVSIPQPNSAMYIQHQSVDQKIANDPQQGPPGNPQLVENHQQALATPPSNQKADHQVTKKSTRAKATKQPAKAKTAETQIKSSQTAATTTNPMEPATPNVNNAEPLAPTSPPRTPLNIAVKYHLLEALHRRACPCARCYVERPDDPKEVSPGLAFEAFTRTVGNPTAAYRIRMEEINHLMSNFVGTTEDYNTLHQNLIAESLVTDPLCDLQGNLIEGMPPLEVIIKTLFSKAHEDLAVWWRTNGTFTSVPRCMDNGVMDEDIDTSDEDGM